METTLWTILFGAIAALADEDEEGLGRDHPMHPGTVCSGCTRPRAMLCFACTVPRAPPHLSPRNAPHRSHPRADA